VLQYLYRVFKLLQASEWNIDMGREVACDSGEDIRAIDALLQALQEAVAQADPDALAALFGKEVSAIFSGTPEAVRGREAVVATWKGHLAQWSEVRITRRNTLVRIHGDVAWGSFLWDGEGCASGKRYRLEGERWTVVMVWEDVGWRLAQMHTSMPYRDWESHRVDG
jgi:uncharacterized protein (TIGR02246 family)